MNTIKPQGLSARDWMDFTGSFLSRFSVSVLKVEREDQWREWGSHVRQALIRRGIIIPVTDPYTNWQDWADRFNQIAQAL